MAQVLCNGSQVQKVASDLRGQWEAMKVLACTEARACELHQQVSDRLCI